MEDAPISIIIFTVIVAVSIIVFVVLSSAQEGKQNQSSQNGHEEITSSNDKQNTMQGKIKLTSPAFEHESVIPTKYTCDGEEINPKLNIEGTPQEAQSLTLIMDDPDVPLNIREDGMFDHWVRFNIPADTTKIEGDEEPEGLSGVNTAGKLGYFPPCPPDTEHRYIFKLYALDTELELEEGATKEEVEKAMEGHILDKTELIGTYER